MSHRKTHQVNICVGVKGMMEKDTRDNKNAYHLELCVAFAISVCVSVCVRECTVKNKRVLE